MFGIKTIATVLVGTGMLLLTTTAQAQNAVDIGGKTSVTGLLSVTTVDPDESNDSTTVLLGGLGAYTTEDARWEFGAGLTIAGLFGDIDLALYNLTAQARINSNAFGPEENMLAYLGAIAGVGIIRGDNNIDDEVGVFGPKVGLEFYVSPKTAVQLQDAVLFDTEDGISNQFTIGVKVLFN